MIYLLNKTHDFKTDFLTSIKFANKKWKGVNSEKIKKYFRWFAVSTCPPGQVLASPDISDFRLLVEFRMLRVQNWVLTKFTNDSACFLLEKLKKHAILTNKP